MNAITSFVLASLLAISAGAALTACIADEIRCDVFFEKMVSLTPEEFGEEEEEYLADASVEERQKACDSVTEAQKDCILAADSADGFDALVECGLADAD